ncbi:MAG: DUF3347 domain-containing protein [Chitinophagaceae bacterium]|nr:DUF3347 domain-containing protein [Chitinophagaceae bacterium]
MKKILDLLAIILPLILLFLPLLGKLYTGRPKKNAESVLRSPWIIRFISTFLVVTLLLTGIIRYVFFSNASSGSGDSIPEPLSVSKHSSDFNESLQNILNAYYNLAGAFASGDTSSIHTTAVALKNAFGNFKMEELKQDSTIYLTAIDPVSNSKAELESILIDPSMDEKRGSLNILSDNLRNLLVVVKYDLTKVYWMQCDQAFGEDKPGNWLSRSIDSKNPYSLKDGKPCGFPKDTLNYMQQEPVK